VTVVASPRLIVAGLAAMVVIAGGTIPVSSAALAPGGATHRVQSVQSRVDPGFDTDPSVVPQTISHPSEPGYNIVPASQFHVLSPGSSPGQWAFRGGRSSTPTVTTPAPPRSVMAPRPPKIGVSGLLNKPGMTATQWTPPDSTGAIGPNHYVEIVNSSIAVYDRNLNLVASQTLTAFIGQPPSTPLCDPQIQWDAGAQRWLYAFLYCNVASSVQRLLVGWSKTTDPSALSSAGWCQWVIATDPYLMDYPKLGHNGNYLIVGANMYNENPPSANPPFGGARINWVSLPANGDPSCTVLPALGGTTAPLLNGDGVSYTFTPVPVNATDPAAASDGYIVSAYDAAGNTSSAPAPKAKVAVWHLDAAGVLHADNDVAVNSYSMPSSAQQLGSTTVLDTLDGRLTQAVGDPVKGFYTQHTVAAAGGRSQVDWYQFTVSGSTVVLAQQGSVASPTDWIFNAAISPRWDGLGAAIAYNRSSASIYPVIAAQIRYQATASGTWAAGELVLVTSSAADNDRSCNSPTGSPCRWGDYSALTPDPNTNLVWGTNQFNTATGPAPAWATQNFAIAPTPEAPTNVRAFAPRSTGVTVSWTPAGSDPGAPPTSFTVTAYIGPTAGPTMTTGGPATSLTFTGLTGATYTFTVIANCVLGPSLESAHSNQVVIGDGALQSTPAAAPPRQPVNQSTPTATPPPGR